MMVLQPKDELPQTQPARLTSYGTSTLGHGAVVGERLHLVHNDAGARRSREMVTARVRGWPAKCTRPPLQHQAPLSPQDNDHRSKCLVNVHAKWRLTPESLRTLRSETKGQAGACPDRTQAIPCKLRRPRKTQTLKLVQQ
jgi:hypothetical protein